MSLAGSLEERLAQLQSSVDCELQSLELARLATDSSVTTETLAACTRSPRSYVAALSILRSRASNFSQQDVYLILSVAVAENARFIGRVAMLWAKNDTARIYQLSQMIAQVPDPGV